MEGKSFDPETYLSYKRALDDPQFEFVDLLDYDDSELGYLKDHHSFKPEDYLKLLISRAMIDSISPVQFHKEMKEIIDLREQAKPVDRSDVSRFHQLKNKYGVKADRDKPGALITYEIIYFLFPHYYLEAIDYREEHYTNAESNKFHQIMTCLEFAAIIPRGRILMETVRTAIVTMHICVLYDYQTGGLMTGKGIIPMPVLQKIVRHRINIGLLSDERRVRFLITKQFITPDLHLSFAFKKEYDKLQETSPELISLVSERLM